MQVDIRPAAANALGSLKAVGALRSISLSWTLPVNDPSYRAAQIWVNTVNDRDSGTLLATVGGNTYSMDVTDVTTRYFWIRSVNEFGRTDGPFTGPASAAGLLVSKSDLGVGAVDLASSQVVGKLAAGNVTGLGALAILDQVGVSRITGLGALATQSSVNGSTQVTNLGTLAYADSIAANNIGAGTLAAGVVYAGKVTADQIYGGTITGLNIDIAGNFKVTVAGGTATTFINSPDLNRGQFINRDLTVLSAGTARSYGSGDALTLIGGTGNIITMSGGGSGIVQQGSATSYFSHILSNSDNAAYLGDASHRWAQLYVASGTISTSDARTKADIKTSELGLNFINALRPVSYRQIVAENKLDYQPADPVDIGPPAPGTETITPRAGVRRHYGLIAQEVREAMQKNGVDDAAFWILSDAEDPDSRQGLRYEELISPLIKAVQELSETVRKQQLVIVDLQAKVLG